jgi:hypothetical protein
MDANNYCLGWHLQTFKHYYIEEALICKDFRIFIKCFYYLTFNWDFFPVDWENNILFSITGYKISLKNPCNDFILANWKFASNQLLL